MVRVFAQTLKIASIVVLTILVAGGGVWFFNYWTEREKSEMIGRAVTVTVSDDDDSASMAEKLQDAELIRYKPYFEMRMRFGNVELKPGTYTLRIGMSVPDIIDQITVKDTSGGETADATQTASGTPIKVTFIEGQRLEENADRLTEAGYPNAEGYIKMAQNADPFRSRYWFLESVPEGKGLEGFLFPATYDILSTDEPQDVIDRQLQAFEDNFTQAMADQAQANGMTVYEAVTLASLVEREAAVAAERPTIAGVYENRIRQDMYLNADPTLQYALGAPGNWWPELNSDLIAKGDQTPWSTNTNYGLPPGPIANPGFASLQAAAQPEQTDYLYFVTKGDGSGEHVFAVTLDEQNQHICEEHPEYEQCGGGGWVPDQSAVAISDRLRPYAA